MNDEQLAQIKARADDFSRCGKWDEDRHRNAIASAEDVHALLAEVERLRGALRMMGESSAYKIGSAVIRTAGLITEPPQPAQGSGE